MLRVPRLWIKSRRNGVNRLRLLLALMPLLAGVYEAYAAANRVADKAFLTWLVSFLDERVAWGGIEISTIATSSLDKLAHEHAIRQLFDSAKRTSKTIERKAAQTRLISPERARGTF